MSELIKIFLSKFDKWHIEIAIQRIILNYDNKTILAEVFVEVQKCDKALYQHEAINLVVWVKNIFRPKKATITCSLAKIQFKRTMYY